MRKAPDHSPGAFHLRLPGFRHRTLSSVIPSDESRTCSEYGRRALNERAAPSPKHFRERGPRNCPDYCLFEAAFTIFDRPCFTNRKV